MAISGTVNLRKGDRFDIGVWIASDGLPMDLRGGNDILDPGNVPDEGGAQNSETSPGFFAIQCLCKRSHEPNK